MRARSSTRRTEVPSIDPGMDRPYDQGPSAAHEQSLRSLLIGRRSTPDGPALIDPARTQGRRTRVHQGDAGHQRLTAYFRVGNVVGPPRADPRTGTAPAGPVRATGGRTGRGPVRPPDHRTADRRPVAPAAPL